MSEMQGNDGREVDWDEHEAWIQEKMGTVMLVAVMVATMTFQAAINPPPPNPNSNFCVYNSIGFMLSSTIVMLVTCGLPVTRKCFAAIIMLVMWGALSASALAFVEAAAATEFLPLQGGVLGWIAASLLLALFHLWHALRAKLLRLIRFIWNLAAHSTNCLHSCFNKCIS